MSGGVAFALRKAVILSKRKRVGGAGIFPGAAVGVGVVEDIFLFFFLF